MSTTRAFIGIDPGLSGALAMLNEHGYMLSVHDTPTLKVQKSNGGKKNTYVVSHMYTLLKEMVSDFSIEVVSAAIEYQSSRPGQGAPATFSQGYGYGLWTMALASLNVPYEIVQPQAWKKSFSIPSGSDKSASVIRATQLFPGATLATPKGRMIDGRAEALLIAEFQRRKLVKTGKF